MAEQGPWPTRVAVLQMHATVGLRKAVHNCHIHFKVGVRALQQHTASTLVPCDKCLWVRLEKRAGRGTGLAQPNTFALVNVPADVPYSLARSAGQVACHCVVDVSRLAAGCAAASRQSIPSSSAC